MKINDMAERMDFAANSFIENAAEELADMTDDDAVAVMFGCIAGAISILMAREAIPAENIKAGIESIISDILNGEEKH